MTIGSLFSGYGGLDMAAEALGFGPTLWHCENDPHASKVLAARWEGIPNLSDITAVDWSTVPKVDVICGGFPCQDISNAGKRVGIDGKRSGLWASMAEAVRQLRPRYVFVENVAILKRRGLDRVTGDLAEAGYDCRWVSLRASAVGAAHRRERLFLVAADSERGDSDWWTDQQIGQQEGREAAERDRSGDDAAAADAGGERRDGRAQGVGAGRDEAVGIEAGDHDSDGGGALATDADDERLEGSQPAGRRDLPAGRDSAPADASGQRLGQHAGEPSAEEAGPVTSDQSSSDCGLRPATDWGPYRPAIERWEHITGRCAPSPTEPGRTGQRLSPAFVEWMMGLPAGWVTGVGIPRNAQLKALGNGVVPQQAYAALAYLLGL